MEVGDLATVAPGQKATCHARCSEIAATAIFYASLTNPPPLSRGVGSCPPSGGISLAPTGGQAYGVTMGTLVHRRRPELGVRCPTCDPDPWGEGRTPYLVRAVFHKIYAPPGWPPAPNDLPFYCEQLPDYPCIYESRPLFGEHEWIIRVHCDEGYLNLFCDLWGLLRAYFTGETEPCMGGPMANTQPENPDYPHGGTGYILDLPIEYITFLAEDCAFGTDPDTLYEIHPCADPDHVTVRFAAPPFPGSCLIKYEKPP